MPEPLSDQSGWLTVGQDALSAAVASTLVDNGVRGPRVDAEIARFYVTLAGCRQAVEDSPASDDEEAKP